MESGSCQFHDILRLQVHRV